MISDVGDDEKNTFTAKGNDIKSINLRATATMNLREIGLFTEEIAQFWHIIESNFAGQDFCEIVKRLLLTLRTRIHNAERRSFHREHENYELTLLVILRLFILQKGLCHYNQKIILQPNCTIGGGRNHIVSIERLHQDRDYTIENTVLCAIQYNVRTQLSDAVFQQLVRGEIFPQPVPTQLLQDANFMANAKPFFQKFINKKASLESYAKRYAKQVAEEKSFSEMKFQEKKRKFMQVYGIFEQDDEIDEQELQEEIEDTEMQDFLQNSGDQIIDVQVVDGQIVDAKIVDAKNSQDQKIQETFLLSSRKMIPQVMIKIEYLYQLYDKQSGRCAYSHHPLILAPGSPFSCSVERIDNSKHYEEGNCFLVCLCMQAGRAKWTRESFIADHAFWLHNFDNLLQTQQEFADLRTSFIANYPPKESKVTAQNLPRIVHWKNDSKNICQFCNDGQSFSTFKALNQHKINLHPETIYTCPHPDCRNDKSNNQHRFFYSARDLLGHYIAKHSEKNSESLLICGLNGCKTTLTKHTARHVDRAHKNQIYEIAADLYRKHNASFVFIVPSRHSEARSKERFESKKRTLKIK